MMSTTDKPKRRIDEELVSVDSLKYILCSRHGCRDVSISREKHDPPDFTVTIDGAIFPVEVTSIVSQQQYRAQCDELGQFIYEHATSQDLLRGKYALKFIFRPEIPRPTSNQGRQILGTAISYIDATRQEATASKIELIKDGGGEISIEKISPVGSFIGIVYVTSALLESEIQTQLVLLIQRAVESKRQKLQKAGFESGKVLLLLYDAFVYADSRDAFIAMQQVKGYDWFHSVFWVASFSDRNNTTYSDEPGRSGLFLFSKNPDWDRMAPRL